MKARPPIPEPLRPRLASVPAAAKTKGPACFPARCPWIFQTCRAPFFACGWTFKLSDGVIDAMEPSPETAEHFAACRFARRRDLVYSNLLADQRNHFAVPRGAWIGQITHIDRQQIQGRIPSKRARVTSDQHLQLVCG